MKNIQRVDVFVWFPRPSLFGVATATQVQVFVRRLTVCHECPLSSQQQSCCIVPNTQRARDFHISTETFSSQVGSMPDNLEATPTRKDLASSSAAVSPSPRTPQRTRHPEPANCRTVVSEQTGCTRNPLTRQLSRILHIVISTEFVLRTARTWTRARPFQRLRPPPSPYTWLRWSSADPTRS